MKVRCRGARAMMLALACSALAGVAAAQTPTPADTVPYRGALPPSDPAQMPPPPLGTGVQAALNALYQRPTPEGPPPIAVPVPKAVYARGKGPIVQVLPGPTTYADKAPPMAQTAMPPKSPFTNHVVRLSRGDIQFFAVDRTVNDTKASADSFAVRATFTDHAGARWRIQSTAIAPLSPDPVHDPWYGGVVVDTTLHGSTGRNTPLEPQVQCAMCSWAWADVYKNDKRVGSSVLLHVMLTSDVRDDSKGFQYACYDCTKNPVREIHIIMPPQDFLPSPGGFLHLMWENAEIQRGTPEQVAARAPKLQEELPVITLDAVPYLNWSQKEIHVKAGQRYQLVMFNSDPTVWHMFHLHAPAGAGDLPGMVPLPHGYKWVTTLRFDKPGEYEFGCPVMNHEKRGMHGKFIVEGASSAANSHHNHHAGEGR